MKVKLILLAAMYLSILAVGCASEPRRFGYRQEQFASRLEYVRFCQHYELLTDRCPD